MEINKEQREKIEREFISTYNNYGFDYGWNGLGNMIINDFLDTIKDYEENSNLESIVNSITGNYNGSYTCNTYESAKIIAENIFEFNEIVEEIEKSWGTPLNVVDTEKNLVSVLLFICDLTILNYDCETLGELIEKLS